MEVSVGYYFCLVLIILVSLYVCLVGIESLAFYSECAGIEYVERTISESSLDFVELSLCSLSSDILIELCQLNRTCFECSCLVSIKCLSGLNCVDSIFIER
jgi:hypothetical protein